MRKPDQIPIDNFDYLLPDERIAKYPLKERDSSRLLIYRSGTIEERKFSDVPSLFGEDECLFFNSTRVVQARLEFRKSTGARIEIFCLEPFRPNDYQLSFSSTEPVEFICLVGNAKKWKNEALRMMVGNCLLTAEHTGRLDDKFIIRFSWNDRSVAFAEILERSGSTPIPPYLNRTAEAKDAITYQTVYARQNGSVAAPTAGLHFTDHVLAQLKEKGVRRSELILHVGAGTFIPVKTENAADHRMHAEHVSVNRELLASLVVTPRVIAVGTTTTRSLESLYWLGVLAMTTPDFSFDNLFLDQWDAYELDDNITLNDSIGSLLEKMNSANIDSFTFRTRIMISPGYKFKVIKALFTNFHQPKSTLLLLIAAVTGDDWKKIYSYALENNFRFLSYGDSSLLFTGED
ncbi:MAG: S-adenosylmethionine:tRNA ribosyltransferase-isomerase [Bacteroidales bacterium]